MITSLGRVHVKRYLANLVPNIGGSIAYGLGNTGETLTDKTLQFEVDRTSVDLVSYNFVDDQLVFKTELPATYSGIIYEIGLYSTPGTGSNNSRIISTFDSARENWTTSGSVADYATSNTRIGADALSHVQTGGQKTSTYADLFLDLSTNHGSDNFKFAYFIENGNTSSIVFRFQTNSSNYYDITINTGMSPGYKIVSVPKANAVATGNPDWANITELKVITNASSSSAVTFDGIRIDDSVIADDTHVLVARKTLTTPYVKKNGMVEEVEFALDFNIV